MNRRDAVLALLALSAAPAPVMAQQPGKMVRIGVLSSTSPDARSAYGDAFKDGMATRGWREGRDVTYVYRYTLGDSTKFNSLAIELVSEKPDLIFAPTQAAALAVKRATHEIPIVFGFATDPVGSGLVTSLRRPGGNATGVSSLTTELSGKHIELLREIQPRLRRVAVLHLKVYEQDYHEAERVARKMDVELHSILVADQNELGPAFESIARMKPDAVLVIGFVIAMRQIVEGMAKLRVPALYRIPEYVVAGGLMSYGASIAENYRLAASYADRILKGAKPADLPVEQPSMFELALNLKTAKALGIKVPQSILLRATRVIE